MMDPTNANLHEQREIAHRIVAHPRTIMTGGDDDTDHYSVMDSAARLAELVLGLDILAVVPKGYSVRPSASSCVVECPECRTEVDVRTARSL